ncbi:MAG: response regulator transcription factor [Nodosilinea sp. LVE1205-7]|jgi:DNA-binding response OmpR family regulator
MKVLVVEDDGAVVQALQSLLASYDYAVDVAPDGEAALTLAETFTYDLMVLDLMLPKLDGLTVCRRLRSQGQHLPILLLAGHGEAQQQATALHAGADDYVLKPFDAEEFMARVQALLRRGSPTPAPILAWGKLQLDPAAHRVCYDIHPLLLTPKEYAILELLLRQPERTWNAQGFSIIVGAPWRPQG